MSSTHHEQHRTFMQHHLDRAMDDDSDATTMNPPPTATTPHPPSSITTKPPSAPTTTENSTERHCERSARIANQVNRSRRFGTNRYDVNESDDDDRPSRADARLRGGVSRLRLRTPTTLSMIDDKAVKL